MGSMDMFDNTESIKNKYVLHRDHLRRKRAVGVCQTDAVIERPQAATNTRGEERFIVNRPGDDRRFQQLVQVRKCKDSALLPSEQCGGGDVFTGAGMRGTSSPINITEETRCKQEYTVHRMVALEVGADGKDVRIQVDEFRFPACCICEKM